MRDFRKFQVWEKSHQLTLAINKATNSFPKDELYGLTSQIRRAASSVPANIAEGCGRSGDGDFACFLQIAAGSASELDYHLLLAHDLGYLSDIEYRGLNPTLLEIKRMLVGLIQNIKEKARAYHPS
jgi:four helix bundle protein